MPPESICQPHHQGIISERALSFSYAMPLSNCSKKPLLPRLDDTDDTTFKK